MEPGYVPAPPEPDLSVIQRLMGLPQTLRAVGQNLAVGAASLPVGIYQGFGNPAAGEAAMSQFQQEYGYTPTNPAAQRQLQGLGEFLQQLETEYKIPPIMAPVAATPALGIRGMVPQTERLARDLVSEIQTTPPVGAISPEIAARVLPETKVVSDTNKPIVAYHATGKEIDQLDPTMASGKSAGTGTFFSSNPYTASTYALGESPNVIPAYLDFKRPMVVDAQGANWNRLNKKAKVDLPDAKQTTLGRIFGDELRYVDDYASTDDLARYAKQQGYDGLVVRNVVDHGPAGRFSTDEALEPSDIYVAFDKQNIRSALSDEQMAGLLDEPVQRESFVPGVPAGQELIVHHNISPEKLRKVEKVGGMPVPSIAISNVENPLTGFGDISLIGNPSMATPSAKNPVFGFDAYTKRAPGITYTLDSKSEKNLKELFSDVSGNVKTTTVYDLADSWNNREFNDLMRAKFLKERGELPDPANYQDKWDYSRDLGARVDANFNEYREWMRDFEDRLPEVGVNIQEKLFRGFTPSGNRRYAEANLQNLVKEMKGGAGSENFNYGVGNLRAVATPKFKKLDDVKAARSKIVSKEEFSEVKSQIDKAHSSLMSRIDELPNKDRYAYASDDVLYEIGSARNVNMIDTFKSDVPDELKADIGVFMRKIKQLPTEYFEIKPQRAVSVSEFEGAIVPADVPQSSVDYLRSQGIERIYRYSTPEERKELFKQFGDKMFSGVPAIGAGLLGAGMMQEEETY